MRFKISLTTRLSLIFSAVMLTVWWLSSFILISTLNGYFDNQDRDFLTGKLQRKRRLSTVWQILIFLRG